MSEEKTLEMALTQLNEIIEKMDKSELSLEDSFTLYNQGMKLAQFCNDKIDRVEKELTILNEYTHDDTGE